MTDELDEKIKQLEEAWNLYHRDPKKYSMPDMQELAKLRSKRDLIRRMEKNA